MVAPLSVIRAKEQKIRVSVYHQSIRVVWCGAPQSHHAHEPGFAETGTYGASTDAEMLHPYKPEHRTGPMFATPRQ